MIIWSCFFLGGGIFPGSTEGSYATSGGKNTCFSTYLDEFYTNPRSKKLFGKKLLDHQLLQMSKNGHFSAPGRPSWMPQKGPILTFLDVSRRAVSEKYAVHHLTRKNKKRLDFYQKYRFGHKAKLGQKCRKVPCFKITIECHKRNQNDPKMTKKE